MRTKFWLEILKGRDHSKDLGVDGKIIVKWSLGMNGMKLWTVFVWLRIGRVQCWALVNMVMNLWVP